MTLVPSSIIYDIVVPGMACHLFAGRIVVALDSETTAFVTPDRHIEMSELIQQQLVAALQPLGVQYMRWWRDGHLIGRTFEART